jgi:hypothetical protein
MSEQEQIVQGTENIEPAIEQPEVQVEDIETDESAKVYTEADFQRMREEYDRKLDKKVSRREAKIRKEMERKYAPLENVLKAGTGKDTVEEITNVFTDFYTKQGVEIPQQPKYNKQDIEVLARHEADEIISQGFEEVIEEAERLNNLGVANMSEREKVIFPILAEYVKNTEQSTELEKIGVTKDVYTSQEFKDFAKKFNPNTPITEIFNIYNSTKPKKQTERIGSMKTTEVQDNGVKDFYTYEESLKYTKEDFDKNPKLWEAMLKSMQQWK